MFSSQRKRFQTSGKDKIQIIVDSITEYEEDPYEIAAGAYSGGGDEEIKAGYSLTIYGRTKKYWRNEERVKIDTLEVSLKINSSPARHHAEQGIIGGGRFEREGYVEVELNIEPWCVKDLINELRRDRRREFRIDGYALSEKVFRVAYFTLSTPQKRE